MATPGGRRRARAGLAAGAALAALLAVLAAARAGAPPAGEAQSPASASTRVVFAIDNSGSMFGAGGEPASDPDRQRIEGVRRLADVLRGFLGSEAEGRAVELGALSFGNRDLEVLVPVAAATAADLAGLRAGNKGGTDFAPALCGAWAMAAGRTPDPAATGCELPAGFLFDAGVGQAPPAGGGQQLVVLITDGSPAPGGAAELAIDNDPPAGACTDAIDYATSDGDGYLCSLAATWAALRAQHPVDLIVIGLDAADRWFPRVEAYWQRAVGCGGFGPRSCEGRVVRNVDVDDLVGLILSVFPTVDLCEAVRDQPYNCDVPGGLVSVGFQVNGADADTATAVTNEAGDTYRSASSPPPREFTRTGGNAHVWRFDRRPVAGQWTLTSDGPQSQLVLVDYTPALFGIEPVGWDGTGLELSLTAHAPVHVASAKEQRYYAELRLDGSPVDGGEVAGLTHRSGDTRFALTAEIERPEPGAYDVVLYLRTPRKDIPVGRTTLAAFLARPAPTPAPTPAPSPTPTPAPAPAPAPPSCVDFAAEWADGGEAPRWRWTVRLGWPPLPPVRFRDDAVWEASVRSEDCAEPIEAWADVRGCEACSAEAAGPPPVALRVPTGGLPGGDAERRAGWHAPSSGIEGASSETVRAGGPAPLYWEPVWSWALHLLVVAALPALASFVAVRSPKDWSREDGKARPIDLAVPDEQRRLIGVVRLGAFAWRRVPGDGERRTLTLRWLVAGPLVARGGSGRRFWLGERAAGSGVDLRRRPRRPRGARG